MWKLIWKELLLYTLTFLSISLLYRHGLNAEQQKTMEQLIKWCREQSTGESPRHESTRVYFVYFYLPPRCLSTSKPILGLNQCPGLPLTFLLGFYVSLVVRRWWEQYCKLPWPDDISLSLRGVVTGEDNNKVNNNPITLRNLI